MDQEKKGVSPLTIGGTIIVAIIFDLIGAIPGVNLISAPIGYLIILLWFAAAGIFKFDLWLLGTGIIELLPVISALPSLTLYVLRTLFKRKLK